MAAAVVATVSWSDAELSSICESTICTGIRHVALLHATPSAPP